MALTKAFRQSDLITITGNQYPQGVCLGLVAQWLISLNKTIGGESTFWTDADGSLRNSPSTPLLGRGYARRAIEFQGQYQANLGADGSSGPYTRQQLQAGGLTYVNTVGNAISAFSPAAIAAITSSVLTSDNRFFIFGVRGAIGGHAIGIYRSFSLVGKSTSVLIFDPNLGKYSCDGETAIRADLATIGNFYNNGLHTSYILEAYRN